MKFLFTIQHQQNIVTSTDSAPGKSYGSSHHVDMDSLAKFSHSSPISEALLPWYVRRISYL